VWLGVAVLVVVVGSLVQPAVSSAQIPEIESKHMSEIVEWVYFNGSEKDPEGCGEVCKALWSEEEGTPYDQETGAFWTELDELVYATGMWGNLGEAQIPGGREQISSEPTIEPWNMGYRPGQSSQSREMELPLPVINKKISCIAHNNLVSLHAAGYKWGPTFDEEPELHQLSWVIEDCQEYFGGGGSTLDEWDPEELSEQCSQYFPAEAPIIAEGEWHEERWWWNHCFEFREEKYVETRTYLQAGYSPMRWGKVVNPEIAQPYNGPNEWLKTEAGPAPEQASVRVLTELALARTGSLQEWVKWVLEGAREVDPINKKAVTAEEEAGSSTPPAPAKTGCKTGHSVNCASGNETKTIAGVAVGGRGPGLSVEPTYNAQLAANAGTPGILGYGWSDAYSGYIAEPKSGERVVHEGSGAAVRFQGSGSSWKPVEALAEVTLRHEGETWVYTLPTQTVLRFGASGYLASITDRDGNAVTLHGTGGKPESVTDAAGRSITFKYTSGGQLESATDPLGHAVKFAYEAGNLVSVTEPGETSARWKFKYNSLHELTSETDGRGYTTEREYNSAHQVASETDPLKRKRTWKYSSTIGSEPQITTITEPNGSITREIFNLYGEPTSITHDYGGGQLEATTTEHYNPEGYLTASTNPDGKTTKYLHDSAGDLTSETNADGDTTEWGYDSTHDVTMIKTPKGETTTIEHDSHGNPLVVSRPAPNSETQATHYTYDSHEDLETVEDPLKRTTKYEYDTYGDRATEIDPEGDKRTWIYNADSQETAAVTPRGNATGAKASEYTTTIERNAQGWPTKITTPLKGETKYTYDADGDISTETEPDKHETKYTYDADDERTKTEEPNKTTTETSYDVEGQVMSQANGAKHETKYVRNALERVTEVTNPLGQKTTKEYDLAGNLKSATNPAKETTTYTYDPANRLIETSYSEGKTPTVKYEYDPDGNPVKMTDGTGTSIYTYDQLDRLTEAKDGHGNTTTYEYDLANEQTKIGYPNGQSIKRTYDKAGRLKTVTDWLEHTTSFGYDPDSDPTNTTFPAASSNVDSYAYNHSDEITEAKFAHSTETLAALSYTRESNGQISGIVSKALPGEEKPSYTYDSNSRLTKAGSTAYEYDTANDPTKIASTTYKYNIASELESATAAKYTYNEADERTKTTPTTGQATTYAYNAAGELTSVTRPEEGKTPAISDSYEYNGNGLRTSETSKGSTQYVTWDTNEPLPLILADGTNSYIYGPAGLPIEQINNTTGTPLYLHHDQQGSTRLLTGSTGKTEATLTYGPYGALTGSTGSATSPLGYDGQYTSADTGLIYLRARTYDPATAQFLSSDPLEAITGEPYAYAGDNPVNHGDPTGLDFLEEVGEGVAGWGDTITFGATNWVREELGINNIDACSGAYQAGGYAGLATGVLIPGEGEAEIGAEGLSISAKIARQMESRGWTEEEIQEAIKSGEQIPAVNKATGDPATRYINPKTGQSVVVDNGTKEVIHVGGPGFKYGPGSGDLP